MDGWLLCWRWSMQYMTKYFREASQPPRHACHSLSLFTIERTTTDSSNTAGSSCSPGLDPKPFARAAHHPGSYLVRIQITEISASHLKPTGLSLVPLIILQKAKQLRPTNVSGFKRATPKGCSKNSITSSERHKHVTKNALIPRTWWWMIQPKLF